MLDSCIQELASVACIELDTGSMGLVIARVDTKKVTSTC